MPEKEKTITASIGGALPLMTELEKERLAGFAEGMAFMARQQTQQPKPQPTEQPGA